jgi:hypothetical protein
MKNIKKAFERPETGPFYLIPDPKSGKYTLLSSFDKPGKEEVHLFLWDEVINILRMRFKKSPVDSLSNDYQGLPRGRIVESGNSWIVAHGSDFPLEEYKNEIISEFSLRDAVKINKVKWEHDPHETMDGTEKKSVEKTLGIIISNNGFRSK